MKRRNSFFAFGALFVFGAVLFALSSCSDVSREPEVGMLSLSLDSAFMQKACARPERFRSQAGSASDSAEEYITSFEVSICGDYSASKTFSVSSSGQDIEGQSVDFANVPLGKSVYAQVKVYQRLAGESENSLTLIGKSEGSVVSLATVIQLTAYWAFAEIPFEITVEFDKAPNLSSLYSGIYAVNSNSSYVESLKSASDNYALFDILKDTSGLSADGIYDYVSLNLDADSKLDGTTLTISASFSLPISEEDPASKSEDVVFLLLSQNIFGSGSSMPKYYGFSQAASGKKKQSNAVSFNASALEIVETDYALYNYDSALNCYNFSISGSATESPSSSDIQSGGVIYGDAKGYPSFCFDTNGNFYALDYDGSSSKITSSNKSFGNYGSYECLDSSGAAMPLYAISCDLSTNTLYALAVEGSDYVLFSTGSLLDGGQNAQAAYCLNLQNGDLEIDRKSFAVSGGKAYFAVIDASGQNKKYLLALADLSGAQDDSSHSYGQKNYSVDIEACADLFDVIETNSVGTVESAVSSVTDIAAMNGGVYVLRRDYYLGSDNSEHAYEVSFAQNDYAAIYSRGAVYKYDEASQSVSNLGWTENALATSADLHAYDKVNTMSDTYFYGFFKSQDNHTLSNMKRIAQSDMSGASSTLPSIYAPSSLSGSFAGPQKFIAIKPKKLVIADDGMAFYSDSGLYYKNANRAVTVDLEKFALSSQEAARVSFNGDESYSILSIMNVGEFYFSASEPGYRGALVDGEWKWEADVVSDQSWSCYAGIPLEDD